MLSQQTWPADFDFFFSLCIYKYIWLDGRGYDQDVAAEEQRTGMSESPT